MRTGPGHDPSPSEAPRGGTTIVFDALRLIAAAARSSLCAGSTLLRWAALISLLASVPARQANGALPSKPPGWQTLGVWRQAEGLPQNSIYSILQTRDGYIWVATKGGVSRFDGV